MSYSLPKLPYDFDALEPHIDAQTMEIHYTKHHQGYIDKLNDLLEGHDDLAKMDVEELLKNIDDVPEDMKQGVMNHGGGHANHSLFWDLMSPDGGGEPDGKLADAIEEAFDSFDNFKEEFNTKATGVFGSGWAWLIMTADGSLKLKRHSFQNSPLAYGTIPLLGIDVWEHAYYLKYQNKRADYVDAWWNVVNWKKVEELFDTGSK